MPIGRQAVSALRPTAAAGARCWPRRAPLEGRGDARDRGHGCDGRPAAGRQCGPPSGRLFLNRRGSGLTRQGLYKIVQGHARQRRA